MNFNHTIGLHLRLEDSLTNLAQQALLFDLKIFQFFLVKQKTDKYITLNAKDRDEFLKLRHEHFSDIFIHSSYWINPSANRKETYAISKNLLNREVRIAQTLDIEYLVLHAGSAKGYPETQADPQGKMRGIDTLVKMLNSVLKRTSSVKILLENSAHGKRTVGNDFHDFIIIREKLDFPEKIGFCLDTAHAFSYGYNLEPATDFIKLVHSSFGLSNLKLIHFNDTYDTHGSMQDRHAFPGHGKIGKVILQELLHHKDLISIPKIIETPSWNQQTVSSALEELRTW